MAFSNSLSSIIEDSKSFLHNKGYGNYVLGTHVLWYF